MFHWHSTYWSVVYQCGSVICLPVTIKATGCYTTPFSCTTFGNKMFYWQCCGRKNYADTEWCLSHFIGRNLVGSCRSEHNMQLPPKWKMLGWTHPWRMTMSEGDGNLMQCNRIPSESAMAESLAPLTHSNSRWTEFLVSTCFLAKRGRKILQVTRRMSFYAFAPSWQK